MNLWRHQCHGTKIPLYYNFAILGM
ncbi:uncharacterized protein FTOL_13787 [Fusarium torulosum]|uniref:Uncharacterized protein n=1 Tax=Fusarium torulosum TaxID=33205 RepID=A0AAE8SQ70_9HYPO|nr:uncharacterized protein FTOL_13787 [Fusarium torulosum]